MAAAFLHRMLMEFYTFILGTLAVWRATHLLHAEDGPWDLLFRLRKMAGNGFAAQLLDCFYCLSLWVAAPFALLLGGYGWGERALLWLALSAGAIIIERTTGDTSQAMPVQYTEDKEE